MARLTHLDVTDLTIFSAGDYLGMFKTLNFNWETVLQAGRAVAQRHQINVATKKHLSWTVDELLTATNVRKTNLDVTLFTVGGTAYLGRLKGGTLKVTTETKDGSGVADLWRFPYAVGTDYDISGDLQIASSADFVALLGAAGVSGLSVAVQVAFAGLSFSAPMILNTVGHKIAEGDIQVESIALKARGLPTVATGHPVLAAIALGDAVVSYSATTGANQVSGNAIITESSFTFNDESLIGVSHQFENQGTPTIA